MKKSGAVLFSLFLAVLLSSGSAQSAGLNRCLPYMKPEAAKFVPSVTKADAMERKNLEPDFVAAMAEIDRFSAACNSLKVDNIDQLPAALEKFRQESAAVEPAVNKAKNSVVDTGNMLLKAEKEMNELINKVTQSTQPGPKLQIDGNEYMACKQEIAEDLREIPQMAQRLKDAQERLKTCTPAAGKGCYWYEPGRACGLGGSERDSQGRWCCKDPALRR